MRKKKTKRVCVSCCVQLNEPCTPRPCAPVSRMWRVSMKVLPSAARIRRGEEGSPSSIVTSPRLCGSDPRRERGEARTPSPPTAAPVPDVRGSAMRNVEQQVDADHVTPSHQEPTNGNPQRQIASLILLPRCSLSA